jgi:hypothetical protein
MPKLAVCLADNVTRGAEPDYHSLSASSPDGHASEIDTSGLKLSLPARKRGNTRKTNECRQEESDLKPLRRGQVFR